jgi:hypothetical protein
MLTEVANTTQIECSREEQKCESSGAAEKRDEAMALKIPGGSEILLKSSCFCSHKMEESLLKHFQTAHGFGNSFSFKRAIISEGSVVGRRQAWLRQM